MSDTYNVGSVEASTKKPADKKLLKLIVASSIGNALEWFEVPSRSSFSQQITKRYP